MKAKKNKRVKKVVNKVEPTKIKIVQAAKCMGDELNPGEYIIGRPNGYKRKAIGNVKTEWIGALNSGRYPQITGSLCRKIDKDKSKRKRLGYCCLGVLSKIQGRLVFYNKEGWRDGADGVLSGSLHSRNPVAEKTSTSVNFPLDVNIVYKDIYGELHFFVNLIDCNDNGMSFKQIAYIINYLYKTK